MLSDKTGTLTENEMHFTNCGTPKGGLYEVDYARAEAPGAPPVLCAVTKGRHGRPGAAVEAQVESRGSIAKPSPNVADKVFKQLFLIIVACNELHVEYPDDDDSEEEKEVEEQAAWGGVDPVMASQVSTR